MKINFNTKTKGIWSATGVVFTQGFEAVLLPFLLFATFLIPSEKHHGIVFSSFVMSIKELVSLIIIFFYMGLKTIKDSMKVISKRKNIKFVLSGVLGTGLGNFLFITGIILAGPAYGVILSAFYPIFAILFNKIFFHEPDNWIVKIGVILTILAGILFIVLPVFLKHSNKIPNSKLYPGMFCGFGAGFFWALEGLLLKKAMEKNSEITKKEIVVIRSISTTVSSFIIFIPLSMIIDTILNKQFFNLFYELFAKTFIDKQAWIVWVVLIVAGLNIVILRIMHTTAIENIGQKLTAIIDTNNFIIPAIFSLLLQSIMVDGPTKDVFVVSQLSPSWLWLIMIPLSIGLLLIMLYHGAEEVPSFKEIIKKLKKYCTKR